MTSSMWLATTTASASASNLILCPATTASAPCSVSATSPAITGTGGKIAGSHSTAAATSQSSSSEFITSDALAAASHNQPLSASWNWLTSPPAPLLRLIRTSSRHSALVLRFGLLWAKHSALVLRGGMMVVGNVVTSFGGMAMAGTALMVSCAAAIGSSGGMMVLDSSDGNSTCGMKLANPSSNGAMMFSYGMVIDSDGITSTGVCRLRSGHMVVVYS